LHLIHRQQQQQSLVEGIPDSEVEFQEQLIQEREGEIEQIEQGITELNQIFKDLGQIVGEQQSMIGGWLLSVYLLMRADSGLFCRQH
jgi:t-SNARE complex subunit (syntaxin)